MQRSLWQLHRSRKRRLLIRKSLDKAPPYSWPVRADTAPEIYEPSQLASVNRLLHRRYQGESERLDVMATLKALSAPHREVLVLREIRGLSYEEISRVMKLSESNVGYLLHTAIKTLRGQMKKESL